MFYYLFYELIYGRFKDQDWYLVKALNVFQYVTFRTAYASITAMLISLVFGRKVIDGLKKWNIGQQIREEGPQAHIAKRETHRVKGEEKEVLVHRKGATRAFPPDHPEVPIAYRDAGQPVIIPGILDTPIVEKAIPVARDFEVRAVYLTGVMAGSDRGLRIIRRWRELGGNAVVFDVKDSDGAINIAFDHPLAGSHRAPIHDLAKFTRFLHSQGMHAIARVAELCAVGPGDG